MSQTGKRKGLTPRGKAMRRCTEKRGITEDPPGSNTDRRVDGIRAWQVALGAWLVGLAWCGTSAADKLRAGGVKVSYRLASVSLIEDDARAGHGPFRDWLAPTRQNIRRVLRGDLVVLFGRGVHVGVVRAFKYVRGVGWVVITEEGNTSPPAGSGSQSNGGWQGRRERALSTVHGFARVDYPGGKVRRVGATAAMVGRSLGLSVHGVLVGAPDELLASAASVMRPLPSDAVLLENLEAAIAKGGIEVEMSSVRLCDAMRAAGVAGVF